MPMRGWGSDPILGAEPGGGVGSDSLSSSTAEHALSAQACCFSMGLARDLLPEECASCLCPSKYRVHPGPFYTTSGNLWEVCAVS